MNHIEAAEWLSFAKRAKVLAYDYAIDEQWVKANRLRKWAIYAYMAAGGEGYSWCRKLSGVGLGKGERDLLYAVEQHKLNRF